MEAMEVDSPLEPAPVGDAPALVSDSSSTEEEEDELRRDSLLPATWAFSQRVLNEAHHASTQATPIRRRVRPGLRVHYPSQTAEPSRGFPDFLLRAPAAGAAAQPESDSSTDVSEDEAPPPDLQTGPIDPAPEDAAELPVPECQQPAAPPPPDDGDGDTCSICLEAWTSAGQHRLSALRCGHLFGFNCIQRWMKSQGSAAKCPQCNKKAKRSDIVMLYAPKLRAMDNTEQENLKRSLELEQSLRRKAELESAQCKLKLQVITSQYGQAQRELQELKALMARSGASVPAASQSVGGARSSLYGFSKAVLVSQSGGCRVLSYCEPLSCLLASQPSPQSQLLPGCGVKKVSVVNTKAAQYVPIHAKQIRGLAFNRQQDSLLLSAALDGTVKLTSLLTNTVVQTYAAGKPVWSCCWCLDNNNYVYAGLSNGSVLVYDTRDTSRHLQELQPLGSRCPLASLCYVPRAAGSASFPCGGLVAASLDGGCFWEQVDETTYRPHPLPLENGSCTDVQVESESRHCLVTYRPGRSNPSLRCVLMALNRSAQQDSAEPPVCSCSPVQTFTAGSSCKLLTRNAVFRSPDGAGTLVCAGDEASNSTMVWDAGSGSLLQKLPADLPVLDLKQFSVNGEHFLASLTEKMVKLYRWDKPRPHPE